MENNKNTQNVIIYGDSEFAEQIYYQLYSDERYNVLAFTVDSSKYHKDNFIGLPIYKFHLLNSVYSSKEISICPAIGYSKLNRIREIVFNEICNSGFHLFTYISKNACIQKNVIIGAGSFIGDFVFIGPNVKIGTGTIVRPLSTIGHDVEIGNFTYCSASSTIGGRAKIMNNSFIGLNSTIKNSVVISDNCIIGSASNVINNTYPDGVYVGNPAKRIKDVDINNIII